MQETLSKCKKLLEKCGSRQKEVTKFVELLEKNTSWLTSPASTRYHLNEKHGLLKHSVGVTETLLKLRELLAPEVSEESCVIVGLFHDLGKIGTFEKPNYIKNDDEWEIAKRNMKYKTNPDLVYIGSSQRSLFLVSQHIKLSDEEAQAILYHDGQNIPANKEVAHRECLLTLLLTFADSWHTAKNEDGRK
ncbi:MAG: HD domain-containing protein [Candidatus Aenigmarchaeota archaeon]|nr:HD domain-containing protein [Candidatus Aenigmarchaeota archaeon]